MKKLRLAAGLCGLCVVMYLSSPPNGLAGELSGDVAIDSEIDLRESAGYADFRAYRVTISTKDQSTTVRAIRDDVERQGPMPLEACVDLWKFLLDLGIEQMTDARPELMPVDASGFSVSFRIGSARHRFNAYAVNSLADTRYQKAIEKILRVAEEHLPEPRDEAAQ